MYYHDDDIVDFTSDEFKERESILNYLKKEFDKDPDNGIDDERIATTTEIKMQKVASHCTYLEQEDYLKIWNRAGTVVWYTITSKGVDATKKEYCTLYQKIALQEQQEESLAKKAEETERKRIENQRHKDNLDVQKESNRWSKWGVVSALIISSIGAIIAILAYFKD